MKKKLQHPAQVQFWFLIWENKTTSARIRDFSTGRSVLTEPKKRRIDKGKGVKGGTTAPPTKSPNPCHFYQERTTDPCSVGQQQHSKTLREALTKKNANTQDVWR